MITRFLPILLLALLIAVPAQAASVSQLQEQLARLRTQLSQLHSSSEDGEVESVPTTTRATKGTASISVTVKNLPDDWRAEDGITVSLYDNETSAWVKGYIVKKGKAKFTGLLKNHEYYLMLSGVGNGEKRVITTNKKSTKVTFRLPSEEEEQEMDEESDTGVSITPILPGSIGAPAQITIGVPFEVIVSAYAPKSGTVKVFLAHTSNKTRLPLGSLRYTTTGADDRFTRLSLKAPALTSSVKTGGGYKVVTTFVSDDGSLKGEEEGSLATVSATRAGAPTITRFTGPTSLKVGETGTWALDAVAASGQSASCRIWWGLEPSIVTPQAQGHSCKTNPLYKHTAVYKKAGTYKVAGEIRQTDQQVASKWLTVTVK